MTPRKASLMAVLLACVLTACTSTPLESDNPAGKNLTGEWLLNATASDVISEGHELGGMPKRKRRLSGSRRIMPSGSGLSFVAQDFQVLRAERVVIELNHDSMGVHYYPGVYRDVSWGERQRGLWEVRAGWLEGDLLIESKAKDLFVVERFSLSRNELSITVAVEADGDATEYTRVYTRR